jgi:hypothetical protein
LKPQHKERERERERERETGTVSGKMERGEEIAKTGLAENRFK